MPVIFLLPLGALFSFTAAYLTNGRTRASCAAIGCVMSAIWLFYVVMLANLELPD